MPDKELINRLIEHYESVDGVQCWSNQHCIGGKLAEWGYLPTLNRWGPMHISHVLDIRQHIAEQMFFLSTSRVGLYANTPRGRKIAAIQILREALTDV